jgi:hypothetical protein
VETAIGAEPYSEETRKKIEELLDIEVYNSYGLSEMNGPGVAFECQEKTGMHLWEDNFLLEIIDPETGEEVPDGKEGEMVLTTLCREAMPIIRYRTRDITKIIPEKCRCDPRPKTIHVKAQECITEVNLPGKLPINPQVEGPSCRRFRPRSTGAQLVEIVYQLRGEAGGGRAVRKGRGWISSEHRRIGK